MKKSCLIIFSTVAMLRGSALLAMTPPVIVPPASLLEGNLDPVSIGVNVESGTREFACKSGMKNLVRIRSYVGYIGYDVMEWWTVFGTIGASGAEPDGSPVEGDTELKWSVGTCAYLFHSDINDPFPFNGRWSLKMLLEYSQYQTRLGRDVRWSDIGVALPISYELFGEKSWPNCNLVLYIGPALSFVNGSGSFTDDSAANTDFEQSRSAGAIGGIDLTFFEERISIGGYIQNFGDTSGGGGFRWHF